MSISPETINKYKKYGNIFVETGTYMGHSVKAALNAGFNKVYTIELANRYYNEAVEMFKDDSRVVCFHGDSALKMPEMLAQITETAVFWLDAHWSYDDTARGVNDVPLYEELTAIAQHPIKNHTILIDDMRLAGNGKSGIASWKKINEKKLKNLCKKINTNYKFKKEDGRFPKDILVAYLEK